MKMRLWELRDEIDSFVDQYGENAKLDAFIEIKHPEGMSHMLRIVVDGGAL